MRVSLNVLCSLTISLFLINSGMAADEETGKSIAFEKSKGNCLSCHAVPNDPSVKSPGDVGPALIGIKGRFPDRAKLRAQIWDATVANPKSGMPPFGRNKILTESEVDKVTDYVYGL